MRCRSVKQSPQRDVLDVALGPVSSRACVSSEGARPRAGWCRPFQSANFWLPWEPESHVSFASFLYPWFFLPWNFGGIFQTWSGAKWTQCGAR